MLEESWQSVYSFHRDKSLGMGWRWAKNKPNNEKRRISRINYRRRKWRWRGGAERGLLWMKWVLSKMRRGTRFGETNLNCHHPAAHSVSSHSLAKVSTILAKCWRIMWEYLQALITLQHLKMNTVSRWVCHRIRRKWVVF